jgi:hypothetical protein
VDHHHLKTSSHHQRSKADGRKKENRGRLERKRMDLSCPLVWCSVAGLVTRSVVCSLVACVCCGFDDVRGLHTGGVGCCHERQHARATRKHPSSVCYCPDPHHLFCTCRIITLQALSPTMTTAEQRTSRVVCGGKCLPKMQPLGWWWQKYRHGSVPCKLNVPHPMGDCINAHKYTFT